MSSRIWIGVAFAAALLLAACGSSDDQGDQGSGSGLEPVLASFTDPESGPAAFCATFSDEVLGEAVGSREGALDRCEKNASSAAGRIVAAELVAIEDDCARVEATAENYDRALLLMREGALGWQVVDIEDPATPTLSDEYCGEVPIVPAEEAEAQRVVEDVIGGLLGGDPSACDPLDEIQLQTFLEQSGLSSCEELVADGEALVPRLFCAPDAEALRQAVASPTLKGNKVRFKPAPSASVSVAVTEVGESRRLSAFTIGSTSVIQIGPGGEKPQQGGSCGQPAPAP